MKIVVNDSDTPDAARGFNVGSMPGRVYWDVNSGIRQPIQDSGLEDLLDMMIDVVDGFRNEHNSK